MSIFDKLRRQVKRVFSRWKEYGEYRSTFSTFGAEIYRSELVRSCIRPLADFTSKAHVRCTDARIEAILNNRPNQYMNGKEFLAKVRTLYELRNNVFILMDRDDRKRVCGFWPVPYQTFEALEAAGRLFIRFYFTGGEKLTAAWEDLAVIRKDYSMSNISGDDNSVILNTLELIATTNQGMGNAIRATANLRGILKSTKGMLSPDAVKQQKDDFVRDYLSLENEGGIASLDSTQEFIPISMNPVVASYAQMKELRENVYRYFGVNENIVTSNMDAGQIEAFYELKIEPFLVDLSTELTSKVFSDRERSFNNWLIFEANKLTFASIEKKIQLFSTVVLYGGMTINEWRLACNMSPLEGGDELIRRLDAATIEEPKSKESEENNDDE